MQHITGPLWASSVFSFFKRLYARNKEAAQEDPDMGCVFFPYKSGFDSLAEALKMPKSRAQWKGKPWYIGWSNCDPVVRHELRKYYNKPYFIPFDAETGDQDWIFMGGPGPGAPIHLDMVNRPSWQAQLSGQKTWTLIPPPECEHVLSETASNHAERRDNCTGHQPMVSHHKGCSYWRIEHHNWSGIRLI
ncbi:hypothetical protein OS493_013177 [Desmophyllum pertusum]|uniref:JmjC domain-containing protein n=1 Tax=Desmophyllum pertusum TaxID=174260 RepID=A0A9W9YQ83_9CNID|nr:hypothetical protein OS493_013177 [Desmophyllum pertusum]